MKYMKLATKILNDSQEDCIREIYKALREKDKTSIDNIFEYIYSSCKEKIER